MIFINLSNFIYTRIFKYISSQRKEIGDVEELVSSFNELIDLASDDLKKVIRNIIISFLLLPLLLNSSESYSSISIVRLFHVKSIFFSAFKDKLILSFLEHLEMRSLISEFFLREIYEWEELRKNVLKSKFNEFFNKSNELSSINLKNCFNLLINKSKSEEISFLRETISDHTLKLFYSLSILIGKDGFSVYNKGLDSDCYLKNPLLCLLNSSNFLLNPLKTSIINLIENRDICVKLFPVLLFIIVKMNHIFRRGFTFKKDHLTVVKIMFTYIGELTQICDYLSFYYIIKILYGNDELIDEAILNSIKVIIIKLAEIVLNGKLTESDGGWNSFSISIINLICTKLPMYC